MSIKTKDGKTHQSAVLVGDNGLPIDAIATIAGSYIFIENIASPLLYGGAVVTLPVGSDLTPVTTAKARYTGRYVLITHDKQIYYIDRQSINISARTFTISRSDNSQVTPASIDLSVGWIIAEADIVNRMATTSAAKIDSIDFRDMHFQMQLDGDPVTVRGDKGNVLEPKPDGSLDVNEGVKEGGVYGNLDMPLANTPYEVKVGTSILANRRALVVTATATGLYWGTDSSVTVATGTPLMKSQTLSININPTSSFRLFLIRASTGGSARIVEIP